MTKGEGIARIAEMAAAGKSMAQAAAVLGVSTSRVVSWARLAGIRFHGRRCEAPDVLRQMREMASRDLQAEIAAAKAESSTAPLYKGGVL